MPAVVLMIVTVTEGCFGLLVAGMEGEGLRDDEEGVSDRIGFSLSEHGKSHLPSSTSIERTNASASDVWYGDRTCSKISEWNTDRNGSSASGDPSQEYVSTQLS